MFSYSSLLMMLLTYFVVWCDSWWGENRYLLIVYQTALIKIMGSCIITMKRKFAFCTVIMLQNSVRYRSCLLCFFKIRVNTYRYFGYFSLSLRNQCCGHTSYFLYHHPLHKFFFKFLFGKFGLFHQAPA